MREENKEPKERASTSSSSSHKDNFVLIDKKYEPIEAAIQAFESRLSALVDLPDKLKQHPNAREEKIMLAVNQQLICDTQTMIEGPLPTLPKGPINLKPNLKTILEVSLQKENAKTESKEENKINTHISREESSFEEIPKADEHLALSF